VHCTESGNVKFQDISNRWKKQGDKWGETWKKWWKALLFSNKNNTIPRNESCNTIHTKFWNELSHLLYLHYLVILHKLNSVTTVIYVQTLVSMITSPTIVTMVKQWVQQWDPLLYKYGFNCHTVVWLAWLPVSPVIDQGIQLRSFNLRHFKTFETIGL
jgi:hypothetical protein